MTTKGPNDPPPDTTPAAPRTRGPKPVADVMVHGPGDRRQVEEEAAEHDRPAQTSDPGMAHGAHRPADPEATAGRESVPVEDRPFAANEAPRESEGLPASRGEASPEAQQEVADRMGLNAALDDLRNTVAVLGGTGQGGMRELVEQLEQFAIDLEAHPGPGGADQAYQFKGYVTRLRAMHDRAFKVAAPTVPQA